MGSRKSGQTRDIFLSLCPVSGPPHAPAHVVRAKVWRRTLNGAQVAQNQCRGREVPLTKWPARALPVWRGAGHVHSALWEGRGRERPVLSPWGVECGTLGEADPLPPPLVWTWGSSPGLSAPSPPPCLVRFLSGWFFLPWGL